MMGVGFQTSVEDIKESSNDKMANKANANLPRCSRLCLLTMSVDWDTSTCDKEHVEEQMKMKHTQSKAKTVLGGKYSEIGCLRLVDSSQIHGFYSNQM